MMTVPASIVCQLPIRTTSHSGDVVEVLEERHIAELVEFLGIGGRGARQAQRRKRLAQILAELEPGLIARGPSCPRCFDQIVMKAIEKDRAARYQTWLEFGKDLSQAFYDAAPVGRLGLDS